MMRLGGVGLREKLEAVQPADRFAEGGAGRRLDRARRTGAIAASGVKSTRSQRVGLVGVVGGAGDPCRGPTVRGSRVERRKSSRPIAPVAVIAACRTRDSAAFVQPRAPTPPPKQRSNRAWAPAWGVSDSKRSPKSAVSGSRTAFRAKSFIDHPLRFAA